MFQAKFCFGFFKGIEPNINELKLKYIVKLCPFPLVYSELVEEN